MLLQMLLSCYDSELPSSIYSRMWAKSGIGEISKMEIFVTIVDGFKPLTTFTKSFT